MRGQATGEACSLRPALVLPYRTAWTDAAAGALFLPASGVPCWALARVFGRDPMSWYRREVGLGRHRIAGTAVRPGAVPDHLFADAHHQPRDGVTNDVATTAGAGCGLGAALTETAGAEDLQAAYGVCQQEAHDVQAEYAPATVNPEGWAATRQAWRTLSPLVAIPRCLVHGWRSIRDRAQHPGEVFGALSETVWPADHAPDRRCCAPRWRRSAEGADRHVRVAAARARVRTLCGRAGA